jgi:DNA repair protein RadC
MDMGSIKDWPEDERPRERLVKYGENNLSDAQLLAILINSGCRKTGENAVDLARKLIKKFNGITGID